VETGCGATETVVTETTEIRYVHHADTAITLATTKGHEVTAENREKWLQALESGKYPQTSMRLVKLDENGEPEGYCCLGVACELAGAPYEIEPDDEFAVGGVRRYGSEGDVSTTGLPRMVADWLGVRPGGSTGGDVRTRADESAIGMNDMGVSFVEIAARFREQGFDRVIGEDN
jgi:hypothetical protein